MRFLVTAGGTREKIDDVREWGNVFTGVTGLGIARALAELGPVDLLTSNQAHVSELRGKAFTHHPIRALPFGSHGELKGALAALMGCASYRAVFMTAAVSDYQPVRVYSIVNRRPLQQDGGDAEASSCEQWIVRNVHAGKVKSSYPQIAVLGRRTEKLVDLFRTEWGYRGLLVKFKLEVGIDHRELLHIGAESRQASGADFLVANTLDMTAGANAGAFLIGPDGSEWIPREALPRRAAELVRRTGSHLEAASACRPAPAGV